MKKTLKTWWNKPWTNGSYVKLTFWSALASLVISLLMIKKIDRDFGIKKKEPKFKMRKNTESRFDEVQNKDFRL